MYYQREAPEFNALIESKFIVGGYPPIDVLLVIDPISRIISLYQIGVLTVDM